MSREYLAESVESAERANTDHMTGVLAAPLV